MEFFRSCIDRVKSRGSDSFHYGGGSGGGISRSWGGSSSGYRGLAGSTEEGVSILGGPPGFLDEEDEEEEEETDRNDPERGRTQGMNSDGVIRL